MNFNNKENERITLPDERVIWLSRSCAVVITVWCFVNRTPYLLLGQRGPGCPDEIGKWNLPCGYLDWNETLTEAAEREVYEETGLNIRIVQQNSDDIISSHMQHPWKISSTFTAKNKVKQSISHHFALIYKARQLPELSMAYCEPGEVSALKWVAKAKLNTFDYAFEHFDITQQFLKQQKFIFETDKNR
jgi:ADP-ribose pyrophosphatase YjhB (NUDIX family)